MGDWSDKPFDAEVILDTYGDMVYKIALSQTKKQQDAEDVFQEVFLRLVKYRAKIESENHLKAWLIRVTMNCCKDVFRSPWREKTAELHENMAVAEADPHDNLYYLVMELPEMYRIVIHLFYYEDMAINDIADTLERSVSTVKSQLHRGRNLLKTKIEREELRDERIL